MNVIKAKWEIDGMVKKVHKEAEQWQQIIQRGRVTIGHIATVNARIFATENLLNNMDKRRELRSTEKRIQQMFYRLEQPIETMRKHLEQLTRIRDSTVRMLSRLSLWIDDELVADHRITAGKLKAPKLLELLRFLRERYDAEWEVKEMVVNGLNHIINSYDLEILVEAWCSCPHAGGHQFTQKLSEFYDSAGRRRSV
ncbi:hypothetical protein KR009_007653, partial [Drosophila setifemur]